MGKRKSKRGGVLNVTNKMVVTNSTLAPLLEKYLQGDTSIPKINEWDVSGVTNMNGLFYNRKDFNEDISHWDVSNVTSVLDMFAEDCLIQYEHLPVRFRPLKATDETIRTLVSEYFRGNPNKYISLNQWNVSRVTNMSSLFKNRRINEDIRDWNVSKVTNMSSMFYGCKYFNRDIGRWSVSGVTNMSSMFYGCENFNQDIGDWTVDTVTNMSFMFYGCRSFNVNLSRWRTINVTNMSSMFQGCRSLRVNLSNWNTTKVITMERMFLDTTMPGIFKPHLSFLTRADGFDVILLVLMHGHTITSCPTNHEPNFANATLLEATPCGINNFCKPHSEPIGVSTYVRKHKDSPTFVTDLQKYLRTFKQQKIESEEITEEDKSDYQWYVREQGWQIITHGYMDRAYAPDSEIEKLQHIYVCYTKPNGAFVEHESLNYSYQINSRTDLMHLLKDSGYGKPLILDFSCGGFEEEMVDAERQRRIDLGRRIKVAGGRKRTLKKRVY